MKTAKGDLSLGDNLGRGQLNFGYADSIDTYRNPGDRKFVTFRMFYQATKDMPGDLTVTVREDRVTRLELRAAGTSRSASH